MYAQIMVKLLSLNEKRPQLALSWGRQPNGGLGAEPGRLAKPAAGL